MEKWISRRFSKKTTFRYCNQNLQATDEVDMHQLGVFVYKFSNHK